MPRRWTDMDIAISAQGIDNIFVGDLPKTREDCMRRFALAAGMPLASFRPSRHQPALKQSRRNCRELKVLVNVLWGFKHRYCDGSGRIDLKPCDVEKVLRMRLRISRSKGKIEVYHLLAHLAGALRYEVAAMTFDYFEMHMICWKLLRRLNDALGPRITDWSEVSHDENHLSSLVFFLLTEEMYAKQGAAKQNSILADAGHILGDMLASEENLVAIRCNLQV